ncbi:hypothetical protein FH715_24880 [Streptomyces sedi]|uniref:Pyrrolo-quinoline quinone repeat domain-containing protein n=2 Tax=Streptomyces sedi TaxID=555059 RepID=A0A5C4UR95_9ACTN|nr:hypothetical protein FH715_24880 [Streptomyces sedi]
MARLWETEMDGDVTVSGLSAWSPDDGPLVFVSDEELVGIDPETGAEEWSLQAPGGEFCERSFEVNDDGVGAVMYRSGSECLTLAAVDAYSGEMLWESELEGSYSGEGLDPGGRHELVIMGEGVVSVAFTSRTVRVDVGSGEQLPALETPWGPECYEVYWRHADVHTLAFGDCSEGEPEIAAFDTGSGERLWVEASDLAHNPVHSGTVLPGPDLAVADDGMVYLFDGTGEATNQIPYAPTGLFGPVVSDSTLVFQNAQGISAFDLRSGESLWGEAVDPVSRTHLLSEDGPARPGPTFHRGAPLRSQADIVDGGFARHLTWWDPRTGEITREESYVGDSPDWDGGTVVHDGAFYQRSLRHERLVAYQLSD